MTLSNVLRNVCPGLAAALALSSAAHAATPQLVSATPGEGDGYRPFPKQLRLTFNEPVAASGLEVEMMDPDGRRIRTAKPVIKKDIVSLTPELTAGPPVSGPYLVTWRAKTTSGEDGSGSFSIFVQ